MYKILSIGGKDYKLQYSIEASLYNECTASLITLMTEMSIAQEDNDIRKMVSEIADIPKTSLILFYSGLMEHHGEHLNGDGTVPDIQTAKQLIVELMREHQEDDLGNFYGVMNMCIEQMVEDDFLKLVGLDKMMGSQAKENRATRRAKEKTLKN